MKTHKVMRIFSDFINFEAVPSHLIWDIDTLYNLLYENENCKEYQDKYLYYGSKAVIPDDVKKTTQKYETTALIGEGDDE
jgi:hypothetical protein